MYRSSWGNVLKSGGHWEWGYLLSLCKPYAERLDTGVVWQFRLSPDARILACSAPDNEIQLWDLAGRKKLRALVGHSGRAVPTAFSAGRRLSGERKPRRLDTDLGG